MQKQASENQFFPRIKIKKTTPKVSEKELFTFRRCYMGISLDNPVFYGAKLEALLSWTVKNFDKCLVVLGDYLRRYNEHIFNGLSGKEAEEAANNEGRRYLSETGAIYRQFGEDKIHLIQWKACLDSQSYIRARALLDSLYASDSSFRASVQADALLFINRQKKHNQRLAVDAEEAIKISCQYLLEEIAVFSSLSEQGWQIELYPGPELAVLVEVAGGSFKEIPEGLKKRINVELQVDSPRI